jgi:hypothetical protein
MWQKTCQVPQGSGKLSGHVLSLRVCVCVCVCVRVCVCVCACVRACVMTRRLAVHRALRSGTSWPFMGLWEQHNGSIVARGSGRRAGCGFQKTRDAGPSARCCFERSAVEGSFVSLSVPVLLYFWNRMGCVSLLSHDKRFGKIFFLAVNSYLLVHVSIKGRTLMLKCAP